MVCYSAQPRRNYTTFQHKPFRLVWFRRTDDLYPRSRDSGFHCGRNYRMQLYSKMGVDKMSGFLAWNHTIFSTIFRMMYLLSSQVLKDRRTMLCILLQRDTSRTVTSAPVGRYLIVCSFWPPGMCSRFVNLMTFPWDSAQYWTARTAFSHGGEGSIKVTLEEYLKCSSNRSPMKDELRISENFEKIKTSSQSISRGWLVHPRLMEYTIRLQSSYKLNFLRY